MSNGFLREGVVLGPYHILNFLGRGAFKSVYRAHNRNSYQNGYPDTLALCVPHAQDPEARKLLENEYRVVSTLDHPGIVKVFGLDEADDYFFMVMEAVDGQPLNEILKRGGALPVQEAARIIREVGLALDYAHEGLAIHRDIKPGNILRLNDGSVKILDFGLARLMAHSQYKAGTRVGSMAFMAPEQFEGAAGMNADLWSLGLTFFQLITNAYPFTAREEAYMVKQILYDEPDLSPIETLDVDPRLLGVMRKILEKDPEKRYQSAHEFVSDLEAVLRHATAVSKTEGKIEVLLRAHFPLVFLQTFEEDRALDSLKRIRSQLSQHREFGFFIWSETRGLRDHENRSLSDRTVGNPMLALKHVVDSEREGVYIFVDIHRHFTPVTIRLIRDAIWTVKRKRKSLVFISPHASLPEELMADATMILYDLPEMDDLRALVDKMASDETADGSLDKPIKLDGALREGLARAMMGLTHREAERVLCRSVLRRGGLDKGCMPEVLSEKEQIVKKAGILEFCRNDVAFSQVGGLEKLKIWFERRRQAFTTTGVRFGLKPPKGVVLVGVPGCGKSLSAKALSSAWDVPLLRLDMGKIYGPYIGSSEANLQLALHTASVVSPCILWIDEVEKAFGGVGQDSGVNDRVFGSFLNWLEDRAAPVFVVATANDITRLPVEFMRKGRFDETFFVDLPKPHERQEIFKVHIHQVQRNPDGFDLQALVDQSNGYSGAEIRESVLSGLYRAFDAGERDLITADIMESIREIIPLSQSREKDMQALSRWAAVNARPAQ